MAGHTLLVHPEVDAWVRAQPGLRRRVDWLLFELATRGEAGRPKGIVGPAAHVTDLPRARWRRSGVGGFHYYAWWFPTDGWDGVPDQAVVVRAVRDHDEMTPLAAGDIAAYPRRTFAELDPLTEEQAKVLTTPARIRLVVGQPGTGKTSALIFAAIREVADLPPRARLLYVTLSRRLADLAGEFLAGADLPEPKVEVVPLADLLARWSGSRGGAATDDDEELAFMTSVGGFAPRELAVWQGSARALWAEVRAYVLGSALPFRLRGLPASSGPIMDQTSYVNLRQPVVGGAAARAAWRVADLFVRRGDLPSVQRTAWMALERLQAGKLDRELRGLGGLIVDEIQDLTLLQIAVLAEAIRRCQAGPTTDVRSSAVGHPSSPEPLFLAAGDESQIVHPSGFDWGRCKNLLSERLDGQPEELTLRTNQRSAAPIVEVANRTVQLYDELQKEHRPRGSARAEPTEAESGEVVLATARPEDDELLGWLELLADTPHNAVVVGEWVVGAGLAPPVGHGQDTDGAAPGPPIWDERFRDLRFTPAQIKGLDRQYVVIWDATRALGTLREEVEAARSKGQKPRFLAARTAIDELRVAVSRATETLVFVDPPDDEPDPLLADLLADGIARARSVAFLRDHLEERNADPRERALGFLDDARDLLDEDLDRALRTLVRVEASLANLIDPEQRRELLVRALEVRRLAARELIEQRRYAEASEQLERLVAIDRELGEAARAEQYAVLASRYREAPPDGAGVAEKLPGFVARYVSALAGLPEDARDTGLYELPRAWIEEAMALSHEKESALRPLLDGARRLAELSGDERDRQAASALSAPLVDALLAARNWRKALDLLEGQPDAPPDKLARCYEGLKAWRQAGDARLAAGQTAEALEDYRRAAAFPEAADLARRLGRDELAEMLGLLAGLTDALGRVHQADLGAMTEDEAHGLARRLRDAADLVTRRRRR